MPGHRGLVENVITWRHHSWAVAILMNALNRTRATAPSKCSFSCDIYHPKVAAAAAEATASVQAVCGRDSVAAAAFERWRRRRHAQSFWIASPSYKQYIVTERHTIVFALQKKKLASYAKLRSSAQFLRWRVAVAAAAAAAAAAHLHRYLAVAF